MSNSSFDPAILSFFGTLLATIPSVIALLYTAKQLRESAKQTKQLEQSIKSGIYNNVVDAEREIWQSLLGDDAELRKWWLCNECGFDEADIKDDQTSKQYLFIVMKFGFYENMFYQNSMGVLAPSVWRLWSRVMRLDMNNPSYEFVWKIIGKWYMEEFRNFVEADLLIN